MSGNIFVSYRRDDSKHAAGRLVDRLQAEFDRDHLFLDVDNIELGLDFIEVINERVAACDVMLVVIGPDWLNAATGDGARRLDDPNDFVRLEVEAALARNIRVIPILVDGAAPVRAEDMPDSLAPLANRQFTRLAHESFAADAETLTTALAKIVGNLQNPAPSNAPAPAGQDPEVKSGQCVLKGEIGVDPEQVADPTRLDRPRAKVDRLGWFATFGPIIFGGILFLVIFSFELHQNDFAWFGPGLDGEIVAFSLPLVGTLLLWTVRGLSSRPPVPTYVKLLGGLLILANLAIVVFVR